MQRTPENKYTANAKNLQQVYNQWRHSVPQIFWPPLRAPPCHQHVSTHTPSSTEGAKAAPVVLLHTASYLRGAQGLCNGLGAGHAGPPALRWRYVAPIHAAVLANLRRQSTPRSPRSPRRGCRVAYYALFFVNIILFPLSPSSCIFVFFFFFLGDRAPRPFAFC